MDRILKQGINAARDNLYINILKSTSRKRQDILSDCRDEFQLATFLLTIIIIHLATCYRAGVSCAVHRVFSSLALALILTLGQHFLLLISIPVAVGALLVGGRRHGLVALYLRGAGVGAGDGWGGVGAGLWVKGAVTNVAALSSAASALVGWGAGCIITIEFI